MSPAQFWKCLPKKFNALCKVHARMNGAENSKNSGNSAVSRNLNKSGGVGAPDTYIDQI